MAEYIEREALIKALEAEFNTDWADYASKNNFGKDYIDGVRDEYDDVLKIICQQKASDVQPIHRGRWDFQGYQLFKCTNCKEIFTQDQLEAMQNHKDCEEWTFPNFCPNCGFDMRGDVKEEK